MRLSWNEIRSHAAAFAKDWHGQGHERGHTQTFYNDFFEVFGVPHKKVAIFNNGDTITVTVTTVLDAVG